MEILTTGASGIIGSYLSKEFKGIAPYHEDCDLTYWESVKKLPEVDTIIHCAHVGTYGRDYRGSIEKNIAMFVNLRRRYPDAKIIAIGSGAMYDKSKPIIKVGEYEEPIYPQDLYGLSKRLTADLADVTLIPFGLYADTRYIGMVKQCVRMNKPVPIIQDVKFSWTTLEYLVKAVKIAIKEGKGRYNVCEFDMTLTEVAQKLGAKEIIYLKEGMANEYTGTTRLR
jgi:nucleoside-diphosphate-sugar epimerase